MADKPVDEHHPTHRMTPQQPSRNAGFQPTVSVIVPARNAETTLEACITSLLQLDYPRHKRELIVVDNASTDRTSEILRARRGEITVLFEQRRGPAAARNRGLTAASGEAIAFTDSDCTADPGWLQDVVAPLEDGRVGIVAGRILATRPCSRIEAYGEYIHDQHLAINVRRPPAAAGANWSSRLSVLRAVGLFDERFVRGQDSELSYRILQAGYKIVHAPEAVIYHRNQKSFTGLVKEGYRHGFSSVRLVKKHERFLKGYGRGRVHVRSYVALWAHLLQALTGPDRHFATCQVVFGLGKKAGQICGSARFLHPAL